MLSSWNLAAHFHRSAQRRAPSLELGQEVGKGRFSTPGWRCGRKQQRSHIKGRTPTQRHFPECRMSSRCHLCRKLRRAQPVASNARVGETPWHDSAFLFATASEPKRHTPTSCRYEHSFCPWRQQLARGAVAAGGSWAQDRMCGCTAGGERHGGWMAGRKSFNDRRRRGECTGAEVGEGGKGSWRGCLGSGTAG